MVDFTSKIVHHWSMSIDTLYIVIIASLSIATVLLTIIGIQTILLLKEIRVITKRANNLSQGLINISQTVERSLQEMSSLAEGVKLVTGIVSRLTKSKKNEWHW